MADNVPITPGSGATVRTVDRSGVESQVMVLDVGGAASESLVTPTNGMPLRDAPTATSGGPTATASTTLFTVDTTGFQSVTVQLTGNFGGGVAFFASNDNTNFIPVLGLPVSDDRDKADTLYVPGMIRIPAVGRYIRAATNTAFVGSVSWSAYLRQQPVAVDPVMDIAADPTIPLPVGGRDASGVSRMLLTGADGGLQLTDAAGPFTKIFTNNSGAGSLLVIDTAGYQSAVIQSAVSGGVMSPEWSNDGINWINGAISTIGTTGPTTTNTITTSNLYIAACIGRWLRIRATSVSGVQTATVYLRVNPLNWAMPPAINNASPQPVNNTQINGVAALAGNGVTGTGSPRVTIASDNTAFSVNGTLKPATTGGLTPFRIITGTTGFIKASAGQLYSLDVYNANAAVRYLHLYNKASAPTLSTDTPVYTIPLPPTSGRSVPLAASIGMAFATGIAWAYTTDTVAIPTTAGTSGEGIFSGAFA